MNFFSFSLLYPSFAIFKTKTFIAHFLCKSNIRHEHTKLTAFAKALLLSKLHECIVLLYLFKEMCIQFFFFRSTVGYELLVFIILCVDNNFHTVYNVYM